jgi:hypothetical protein
MPDNNPKDSLTRRKLLSSIAKVTIAGTAGPIIKGKALADPKPIGPKANPTQHAPPTPMSRTPHPLPVPDRGFVSSKPAKIWEEGLLCGNGTIGMLALSRPLDERIIFCHERLFMPMGDPVVPPDQSMHLPEIRKLIADGKYKEACELQFKLCGQQSFMYPDFFVPAFDMTIHSAAQGEVRDYARSVNFQTGEAVVHWADDRGVFERRMFVSRKDGMAVVQLTGPTTGSLNCRLKLEPRELGKEYNDDSDIAKSSDEMFKEHFGGLESGAEASSLTYRCRFLRAYPGSIHALESYCRVVTIGGKTIPQHDGTLVIQDADRVLLLLDIRLLHDAQKSEMDSLRHSLAGIRADYPALLARHAKVHGGIFNRVRLDLGGGEDRNRTTEELLNLSTYDDLNPALVEKEFDAGRYNILSATGRQPPTLQGRWGGTYVPGWASDFTHNGNLPSAIAANLSGNMPELMLAYTSYIESIMPALELNAKHLFGARGILLPSRSTTTGYNNALAPTFAGGMWVAGAGWAAHFFYDYFLYTGDRKFLAKHALPFMEKVALFFEDYLYEGPDGRYIFSPTQSPENTPANSNSQATFNATMDVGVAKELLRNTIAASRELGLNADRIPVWQQMLTKMPDYEVDENGIIKEWLTPRLANNDDHRHSSQLYPLYYGMPAELAARPDLQAAFRKSVEYKLLKHWKRDDQGYMSFGLVQLGQVSASLGEGELAYHCLRHLVNRFWLSNLASTHNQRSLFNTDISGGMPAVIIQMLVASEPGRIKLLPALPNAWPKGTLEGVLCRGAIEINRLHWDGSVVEVELTSARSQEISLSAPAPISEITVTGGHGRLSAGSGPAERQLSLSGGRKASLRIGMKP